MKTAQKINDISELKKFARDLVAKFGKRQLVLLNGPMGAGKTELVKAIVEALGGGDVASPTFALHHRYELKGGPVDHIDLFRLKSPTELEESGIWDLFEADRGLILIEWSERVDSTVWPRGWVCMKISIEVAPEGTRTIVRTSSR